MADARGPRGQYRLPARREISSSGFTLVELLGDITDGTSNTIMFGEMSWDVGPQEPWIVGSTSQNGTTAEDRISSSHGYVFNAKNIRWGVNLKPYRNDLGEYVVALTNVSLGSYHPGGTHTAMTDGSAKFIRDEIDVTGVYRRMASRASDDLYDSSGL